LSITGNRSKSTRDDDRESNVVHQEKMTTFGQQEKTTTFGQEKTTTFGQQEKTKLSPMFGDSLQAVELYASVKKKSVELYASKKKQDGSGPTRWTR